MGVLPHSTINHRRKTAALWFEGRFEFSHSWLCNWGTSTAPRSCRCHLPHTLSNYKAGRLSTNSVTKSPAATKSLLSWAGRKSLLSKSIQKAVTWSPMKYCVISNQDSRTLRHARSCVFRLLYWYQSRSEFYTFLCKRASHSDRSSLLQILQTTYLMCSYGERKLRSR